MILASRIVRISRLISTSRSFLVGGVDLFNVSLRGTILTATYIQRWIFTARLLSRYHLPSHSSLYLMLVLLFPWSLYPASWIEKTCQ